MSAHVEFGTVHFIATTHHKNELTAIYKEQNSLRIDLFSLEELNQYVIHAIRSCPYSRSRTSMTLTLGNWEFSSKVRNNLQKKKIHGAYSLNKKEWICSLFKEWILEKSEIWSEHLCYSLILEWPQGSLRDSEWSLRSLQNEWITQMFTQNFTLF